MSASPLPPPTASPVAEARRLVTATPATEPILTAQHLHPGLHVTPMGSDQPGKIEIAPEALAAADLYVGDRRIQSETFDELKAARAAGVGRPCPRGGA